VTVLLVTTWDVAIVPAARIRKLIINLSLSSIRC